MKNIFYLLLILAVNQTYSQHFENFAILEDEMRYTENMMISESGNIIIWGTTNQSFGNVFVSAINMDGEIIWSSYFLETQLWWADLYEKQNGNFLLPMSHIYAKLPEISPSGDSIKCTYRQLSQSYFGSVLQMPSGNYLLTELIESSDPWTVGVDSTAFIIIDDEGSILDYHPTELGITYDLFSIDENEFYAIASTDTAYGSKLVKFNWDFNILSVLNTSKYEASMPWIEIIQGNRFLHAGSTLSGDKMQAVISMQNEETGFVFDSLFSLNYFMSITHDPIGKKIFALGNQDDSCYVLCLDYEGSIWGKWMIEDSLEGTSIKYYNDHIFIAGVYNYGSQEAHSCIFKIDTDSLLSEQENVLLSQQYAYPNPFSNQISIDIKTEVSSEVKIKIFDMKGSLVRVLSHKGKINSNEPLAWDGKNTAGAEIPVGVYIASIVCEDKFLGSIRLIKK